MSTFLECFDDEHDHRPRGAGGERWLDASYTITATYPFTSPVRKRPARH